jgi:hypothetical protein
MPILHDYYMKKLVTILTIFGLALSLLGSDAFASSSLKAGSSCKKLWEKITVNGYVFTCVKSGKKAVWEPGKKSNSSKSQILVPKPVPSQPMTPTAIAPRSVPIQGMDCPPNSDDVIGYDLNQNFVDLMCNQFDNKYFPRPANQNPISVDPKTGLKIPSQADSTYMPFLEASFTQLLSLPDVASPPSAEFIVDPDFSPSLALKIENAATTVLSKFGNLVPSNLKIIQVLSTSSDFTKKAFTTNATLKLATPPPANGSYTFPLFESNGLQGIGTVYGPPWTNPDLTQIEVGAHETFHAIQYAASSGKGPGFLPMWFVEGQATQMANIFTSQKENYTTIFNNIDAFPYPPGSNDLVAFETYAGMDCCGNAYSRGMAASNYLTSKYGWEKILSFDKASLVYSDWKSAFQTIFGIPAEVFYKEIGPYLSWMATRPWRQM